MLMLRCKEFIKQSGSSHSPDLLEVQNIDWPPLTLKLTSVINCLPNKRNDSLKRRSSFSDTDSAPEVRRLRGPWGSVSETDLMRKALVDELHQRFSSTESLKQRRTKTRYRAASVSGLTRGDSSEWKSTSIEELRARKSSKSIEVNSA